VGQDFARLEDGQMKKVGGHPAPLLVEMPLVCVLFDVFKARKVHLRQEAIDVQNLSVHGRSKFGSFVIGWFVRLFGRLVALPIVLHTTGPLVPDLIGAGVDNLAERLERMVEGWEARELQELQRQKEAALQVIHDEESALDSTLNCFYFQFRKLQETFPSSDFDKA
jgi:hypothetical protein